MEVNLHVMQAVRLKASPFAAERLVMAISLHWTIVRLPTGATLVRPQLPMVADRALRLEVTAISKLLPKTAVD